nr:hypothetical protein [Staphylococcus saprophyticus]
MGKSWVCGGIFKMVEWDWGSVIGVGGKGVKEIIVIRSGRGKSGMMNCVIVVGLEIVGMKVGRKGVEVMEEGE